MTISEYNDIVDLLWKLIGGLVAVLSTVWAFHRFYLGNTFLTKKEFRTSQIELESRIEAKIENGFKPINEQIKKTESLDRDFAVFKATYAGDSELLKEQMRHANEFNKQILHRVNNLASVDIKAIIKDAIKHE